MLKLLKRFNKKDVFLIFVCIAFIVFQVWLDLKLPDYMSEITTLLQADGTDVKDILIQGAYMLLCALGSLTAAIVTGYLASFISATFSKKIRKYLFEKVESFGMEEMRGFNSSSLITRTTNDITNIPMFISMGLQLLIKAPITAVWAVLKILNKSWQWSAITGGAIVVLLILVVITIVAVLPKFKLVQKLIDKINNLTREHLIGIRVVRAFNAEGYQEEKFEKANNNLTKTQMFNQRMMSTMSPLMYLIMNTLTLAIYFVGSFIINNSAFSLKIGLFSDMVVFTSYAMQVIMSFLMLAVIFIMYPRASVSADRINEVLKKDVKVNDGKFNGNTKIIGEVEFKNVSFKYPDAKEYVIKDISFKANKGDVVAFIGSCGSGKSTLINLIPRFYDATDGEILIDGVNIKDYKLGALHDKIGYVPQKAVMFNGTINYNISYGKSSKKISDKEIKKAAEIAQALEFIDGKELGFDENIAEGGTNISGGQKQRLAIARAIARDPEIYIFDDSFSALDYKTESILRKELKEYTKDATSLIVAQRIGTIMNADKIVVLDEGKCVGIGTHKELMKNCSVYREIAYSQLSKEELENA